jgi:hypothetical protein
MIRFHINREQRLITFRFAGTISLEKWEAVLARVLAECPDAPTFDTLNDGRAPHSVQSLDKVVRLAEAKQRFGMHEHRRRAVGLVSAGSQSGFLKMLQRLSEDSKVARLTTDSIEAAADWLCRPVTVIRTELARLERATVRKTRAPRATTSK